MTDQTEPTGLRDRLADVLRRAALVSFTADDGCNAIREATGEELADAVLAELAAAPAVVSAPVQPTTHADVYAEVADRLEASARKWDGLSSSAYDEEAHTAKELRAEAAELRRMAGQPAKTTAVLTDRVAVLREEAALIRAHCPDHLDSNSAEGSWMFCHCDVADDMIRRAGVETPQAAKPTVAYSGKGRCFCLTCPRPADENVQLTVDRITPGECCWKCGRELIVVARQDGATT